MSIQFEEHVGRIPGLYRELMNADLEPLLSQKLWRKRPAIYVFYDGEIAVHVGRTRNLQQRMGGHLSNSHFSASFAFKQTRRALNRPATYRKGDSRTALFAEPDFRVEFDVQQSRLRQMRMRHLEVAGPIDQYLLELYATMELGLSLEEFDTH